MEIEINHETMKEIANSIMKAMASETVEEYEKKLMDVATFNTNLLAFILIGGAPSVDVALEGLEAYKKDVATTIMSMYDSVHNGIKKATN